MQTIHKPVAVEAIRFRADSKDKDGSTTCDPWNPELPPIPACPPTADISLYLKLISEHEDQAEKILSESRATNTFAPDCTPQTVLYDFCAITVRLSTILEKDSVRAFLNLFKHNAHRMTWGLIFTPQAFNFIVARNAVRCAKVALEGKAPQLACNRANPNYMNSFGFFPLHQAAAIFSLDMINLLLDYGASANLRTAGNKVIEGLLPLHVAVENTCMHKYLEDNLLTDRKHLEHKEIDADYIHKLIHILCLPEMKMFLDTVRLLAKKTDNLVDEIWNYIKDGKLIHTAILLLAAQQQLRSEACKGNGNLNGLDIIKSCIFESTVSLEAHERGLERGKNGKAPKGLKEKRDIFCNASVLVSIMSQVGEALDAYVQTYSEVPHHEVIQHVSSVLKDRGFVPSRKGIDVQDLYCCPYDCEESDSSHKEHGHMDASDTAMESPKNVQAKKKQGASRELPDRQQYRMFIPYWRTVLKSRLTVKVYPPHALKAEQRPSARRLFHTAASGSQNRSNDAAPPFENHNMGLLGRVAQLHSNHQSRRPYGTAALTLLKMLRRA